MFSHSIVKERVFGKTDKESCLRNTFYSKKKNFIDRQIFVSFILLLFYDRRLLIKLRNHQKPVEMCIKSRKSMHYAHLRKTKQYLPW